MTILGAWINVLSFAVISYTISKTGNGDTGVELIQHDVGKEKL